MNDPLKFLDGHKKIAVFGEAGSGKTELAMNLAALIRANSDQPVRFFDMDQTKPMHRAQDAGDLIRKMGITFHVRPDNGDTPSLPYAVIESIKDPDTWTLLDVGGGQAGALCMGQFTSTMENEGALVYYTINTYRAFSDSTAHIKTTMDAIFSCCGLSSVQIVSNPYIGPDTTMEDVREGQRKLQELLKPLHLPIALTLVPTWLYEEASRCIPGDVLSIDPYIHIVPCVLSKTRQ